MTAMTLSTRQAYVLGWVFGAIIRASNDQYIGGPIEWAAQRPFTGMGKIITAAHQNRLLTKELDEQVAEALAEIDQCPDEKEQVQSLENQGSWQLGYYAGKSGRPLANETFDIAAARKQKNLTQIQLADAVGVTQALVSRWETGKVSPNKEHLQKIREVLS